MLIFSVLSVALFFLTFAKTRERVAPLADQRGSFGEDLLNMLRNRPWVALFFSGLFTLVNAAVRNGSIIYYFKYVVRDEARFTLYATSGFVAFIAGAASTKLFLKLGDRRTLMIALSILNALMIASVFLVDPRSYAALRSEEHTSELQSPCNLVCRLLLEKKKKKKLERVIIDVILEHRLR